MASSSSTAPPPPRTVTLQSSDGQEFTLSEAAANLSPEINAMLSTVLHPQFDGETLELVSETDPPTVLPLKDYDGKTLDVVVNYLKALEDAGGDEAKLKALENSEEFLEGKIEKDFLADVFSAAKYLGINGLKSIVKKHTLKLYEELPPQFPTSPPRDWSVTLKSTAANDRYRFAMPKSMAFLSPRIERELTEWSEGDAEIKVPFNKDVIGIVFHYLAALEDAGDDQEKKNKIGSQILPEGDVDPKFLSDLDSAAKYLELPGLSSIVDAWEDRLFYTVFIRD